MLRNPDIFVISSTQKGLLQVRASATSVPSEGGERGFEALEELMFGRGGRVHRAKGDQHRAQQEWPEAAEAYQRHLAENPADQPIYVQLGHALKEQGRLPEAMGAYATAVALNGTDPDALRHLADALRRLGRRTEALQAYHRANRLEPSEEAASQIALLTESPTEAHQSPLEADTILLSVQDLLAYLREHTTLSGIQRVQVGIAAYAIRNGTPRTKFIVNHLESAPGDLPPGQFWMIDSDALLQVIRYVTGPLVGKATLRALIRACEASARPVSPGPESTIIILGAFWTLGNGTTRYLHAKRAGACIGVYLYDIIPITHPEFCDDQLTVDFLVAFCEMANISDFYLTISDFTRHEVDRFLKENGAHPVPSATVRLAHHLSGDQNPPAAISTDPLKILNSRPYVAYISTVEARKNHLYVVEAWQQLIAEGVRVPDLVFVGRKGWKIDPLLQLLEATNYLGGRVHILEGLSDEEVDRVYSNCLFTVFTSMVEGWGLPAGESLYFGRPCIASRNSSIPEVGGDFLDYVDPLNLRDGIAAFRRMIEDADYRERRAALIAAEFEPRTWDVVSGEFFRKAHELRRKPRPLRDPTLREGILCQFDLKSRAFINTSDYLAYPYRIWIDSTEFEPSVRDGMCWRGQTATLSIPTELEEGEPILLFLLFDAPAGFAGGKIAVAEATSEAAPAAIPVQPTAQTSTAVRVRVPATIQSDGAVRLRLFGMGPGFTETGPGVRLRGLGYAAADNINARQEIVEQLLLTI